MLQCSLKLLLMSILRNYLVYKLVAPSLSQARLRLTRHWAQRAVFQVGDQPAKSTRRQQR